jgi:pilus assembly protein Flp/PilA
MLVRDMRFIIRRRVTREFRTHRDDAETAALHRRRIVSSSRYGRHGPETRTHSLHKEATTMNSFVSMIRDDAGATLVEYSLIVALIGIACIGAVTTLGGKVSTKLNTIGNSLN